MDGTDVINDDDVFEDYSPSVDNNANVLIHAAAMEDGDNIDQLEKATRRLYLFGEESQSLNDIAGRFEASSRQLHLNDEELKCVTNEVSEYLSDFFANIPHYKTYEKDCSEDNTFKQAIASKGKRLRDILDLLHNNVIMSGLHTHSGGNMALFPSGGLPLSAFGDFIAAFTNKYTGIGLLCPGGVKLENHVLEWAASLFGFDKATFGGNLCSGSSIAMVMCVAAARDKHDIKAREYEKAVIYTSEETHFCLEKALRLIGMRESVLHTIPVDANYSINTSQLETTIEEDIKKGLNPFLIVGTIGTTSTGSVDDINKLSMLAKEYNCWLHVDGAYGGFFCLLSEMKEMFVGIENADSLNLDAHKTLFLPSGLGIALVKNREDLLRTFNYSAAFLEDSDDRNYAPGDLSPELTRNFRGLHIWLPLLYHGVDAFADALREKVMLTRYAYAKMKDMKFIDLGPSPPFTTFIFRFNGHGIYNVFKLRDVQHVNLLNEEIKEAFIDDGRVLLSHMILKGVYWLRVAVLCIRTHKEDMDTLLDMIRFHFEKFSSNNVVKRRPSSLSIFNI